MDDIFSIKITLPSGNVIKIPELKNKLHQTILKYCENSDLEGLCNFFENLLFKGYGFLNIIDKFYTLLTLRMIFIDPNLTFVDQQERSIKFDISNILEKIDHLESDFTRTITIQQAPGKSFNIELGLPNILYFKDINDIYNSVIKGITFNNHTIDFSVLGLEEREEILSQMPSTLFTHISKYVSEISKQLQSFVLIEENTAFNIEEISTDIISNEFMNFIISIFSTGLKNFFDVMYIVTTKLNIDGTTFFNLTPLDTRVLINIYNKDIDDQNKLLQSKNRE